MFIHTASAEIQNNLTKTQDAATNSLSFGWAQVVFVWLAVIVGILGFFILVYALFLYLLAAGDESGMQKTHNVLWGGIFCIVGSAVLYFIGIWLGK